MKILLVGLWGREHALAEAYSKSRIVEKVFVLPGNGLMDFYNEKIVNVPHVNFHSIEDILTFVKKQKIDFADISAEDFIAAGYVDRLRKAGLEVFGPTKSSGRIESSKDWSRSFMLRYGLPIPHFKSFNNKKKANAYVDGLSKQTLYIKASGLCGGKGAVRAENKKEALVAISSMSEFGKAGEIFLIEEALIGEEFSFFVLCDGVSYIIAKNAQDHKTVFNADEGPNTGGMGCVSPTGVVTPKIKIEIEEKIIKPFLKGMQQENVIYQGVLYIGGILTHSASSGQAKGVKIIEFNARWGSPEAEVILPSIKTDYMQIAQAVVSQKLAKLSIRFDNRIRVSVCGSARGYPGDFSIAKGKEIFGIEKAMEQPGIKIYGAAIKRKGKRFFVNGGRLFHLVAEGKDIYEARKKAYEAMSLMYIKGNNLHYRTDIGWRELERVS